MKQPFHILCSESRIELFLDICGGFPTLSKQTERVVGFMAIDVGSLDDRLEGHYSHGINWHLAEDGLRGLFYLFRDLFTFIWVV